MRLKGPPPNPLGLQEVLNAAAEAAGTAGFPGLLAAGRSRTFAMWRQAIMLVLRERLHMSYPEIAAVFGYDHSTIVHGVRNARVKLKLGEGLWTISVARLEVAVSKYVGSRPKNLL